jgi:membrane associated rhomboid family serine protease
MLLRLVGEYRRAMDLSLVLDAEDIPHELRQEAGERWVLVVDDADAARADQALAAFERENPRTEIAGEAAQPWTSGVPTGLVFFLALLGLHIWTGPDRVDSPWFQRGSAEAAAILHGQWWRAVTALTLHADAGHAAGNALLGGLLLSLLARALGPGVASLLLLLSGTLGTLATAALLRHDFASIGASTAVFGALGALAVLPQHRRKAWLPLAAAVALLGFLGTSKRADLAGHLCGFAAGVLLGALAALAPRLRNRALQAALAFAAAAVPVMAWVAAFR